MNEIFGPVFFLFIIFLLCAFCGWCCRRTENGAIYSSKFGLSKFVYSSKIFHYLNFLFSAPVIVTSTTHQPLPGQGQSYSVQVTQQNQQAYQPLSSQMPIQSNFSSPYNPTVYNPAMHQHTTPYPPPHAAPYPSPNAAQMYLPQVPPSAPRDMENPPTYNEVVDKNAFFAKQQPYNPNF
jgi:hypothetical protein